MTAGFSRAHILAAVVGVALLGSLAPAFAETYEFSPDGTHDVAVGTNGSDADGVVAVSDSGDAQGRCVYGGSFLGCLTGPGLAVSGTGTANGASAASGTGNATATGPGWGIPAFSISGTGCATASHPYDASVVASGTGCAAGSTDPEWGDHAVAVSGTGDASGSTAVSAGGNARGGPGTYVLVTFVDSPGVAVAGLGDANAPGGLLAVSGTGDAHGATVNLAPLGNAG